MRKVIMTKLERTNLLRLTRDATTKGDEEPISRRELIVALRGDWAIGGHTLAPGEFEAETCADLSVEQCGQMARLIKKLFKGELKRRARDQNGGEAECVMVPVGSDGEILQPILERLEDAAKPVAAAVGG